MWQYTTETIINSNKGHLGTSKDKRFDIQQGKLLIEGVGAFELAKIEKVWKRAYQPAQTAYKKITLPTVVANEVYRLQVWVSEEGTIRPELQNAMLLKSLPFQFEVKATSTAAADLATAFEKAVKTMFAKKGADRLFTVVANSSALEFEATDCYVRFDEIKVDKIADTVNLTGFQDYDPVTVTVDTASERRGTEGNGTVARLVKNLRLPTKVSLDPFGADQGGKPVPGGKYNQYMFEYVTDRSHVGHQVFGSVGDQTLTTHILFIEGYNAEDGKATGAAAEFEALISSKLENYTPETPTIPEGSTLEEVQIASAKEGRGAKK